MHVTVGLQETLEPTGNWQLNWFDFWKRAKPAIKTKAEPSSNSVEPLGRPWMVDFRTSWNPSRPTVILASVEPGLDWVGRCVGLD